MRRALLQSCWCCFLVASGAGSSGETAELKVGVAAVKITPARGRTSRLAVDYAAALPTVIAERVRKAETALAPGNLSAAIGREETLAFNRRFHLKDGSVGWNPGKFNPAIVRPAGPIDPAVPVVYFATVKDEPLAFYVNYAMHLDTVGGLE